MRSLVATVVLTASVLPGGCASQRALREDPVAVLAIEVPSARRATYRAALSVMTEEGYSPLHAAEPDGFAVYHERLRPEQGGAACEDVRLDAAFETGDDRATLAFAPCLVESKGALFAEAGMEICIPQTEWRAASCIDEAIARLKLAWRREVQQLMSPQGADPRGPGASSARPRPYTNAALEAGAGGVVTGECMKDTECKGERICDSGRCVDPARP